MNEKGIACALLHETQCPQMNAPGAPHRGGPILNGAATVFVNGKPIALAGVSKAQCSGPPDLLVQGSLSVLAEGKPVARKLDKTAHLGFVKNGSNTVLAGG